MVGVGVILRLFAHKMNEQNPRLSQYLAMTFLFLFLWGCALMIWGSGGYFAAVVFAALGTALPLYCLKGMKGTENMSETEHFQLGKVYIVMFSDLEEVQTGLENCFGTGETFDVTGVPEECFRPAGVLENTLMKTIKLADRQ